MHKYLIPILLLITLTGCTAVQSGSELVISKDAEEASVFKSVDSSDGGSDIVSDETVSLEPEEIVVYVCGAVINPGVYELSSNSRAGDAVTCAGGFSEDADINYVNLAAPISDGSKLFIPTVEEVKENCGYAGEASFGDSVQGNGLININTASVEELKTLPGVGDVTANKIVEYRQKNGNFKSIEDIMKVSGIKDKLFSKIKEKITTS